MFSIQKQFSAATKTELASQIAALSTLAGKTVEAVERLVNLNIETVKAAREESALATKKILSASTPQQFFAAAAERFQSNIETIQAYAMHLADVSASTRAEFIKAAQLPKGALAKAVPLAKTEKPVLEKPVKLVVVEKSEPEATVVKAEAVQQEIVEFLPEPIVAVEPVAEPVAKLQVVEALEKPAVEKAPPLAVIPAAEKPAPALEKPAAKKTVAAKPRAKSAPVKASGAASFPKPAVKALVKKSVVAKPVAPKTAAAKNVAKTAAKKKS